MLHIGGGYNKSNGEGIARVLEEHIGKSNIEELFIKELASKGAGYARIFGGDMNLDWDKATATRKEYGKKQQQIQNEQPRVNTPYIAGEQKTKIDWAIVEGGHINEAQISDNPPGLSKHRMILIDMTNNELSMKLEKETSGEERPTSSPIMETKGENANKLRKKEAGTLKNNKWSSDYKN
jgi:hypothetical protein